MIDSSNCRRAALKGLLAAALAAATRGVFAASWPSGTIRLIVPFAAGGPADNLARVIAERLSARLGHAVVVENMGGAGGSLGMKRVASSSADGSVFGYAITASHVTSPFLYENFPYDAIKDFTPISLVAQYVNILVVRAESPFHTVADLIAYAKANPGKLTFGSAGIGSTNHLAGELLMRATGTTMRHVPYKGSGPALIDVVAGTIDMLFDVPVTAMPLVQAGKLRALGSTVRDKSAAPSSVANLVPIGRTVPGFELYGWTAIVGPAGLPHEVVSRMNKELVAILSDEAIRQQFDKLGFEAIPSTPEQLTQRIRDDQALWGPIIRKAGLKAG